MTDTPLGPVDGTKVPRFAGSATFARLPRIDEVASQPAAAIAESNWTTPAIADLRAAQREADRVIKAAVGEPAEPVVGRRREDGMTGPVALVLAAPDVDWDGRIVRNPVAQLGADWVVVSPDRAEHPETGATLVALEDELAGLAVPIGDTTLRFVLRADASVAAGAAPVVEDADATLGALLAAMAGGRSGDDDRRRIERARR